MMNRQHDALTNRESYTPNYKQSICQANITATKSNGHMKNCQHFDLSQKRMNSISTQLTGTKYIQNR